jgi:hypothetical protein
MLVNVSVFSRGSIFICEVIIPPLPIRCGIYRCGKDFVLDELESLFETHQQLGIVIVGGDYADIYTQEHTRCTKLIGTSMCRQKAQKCGGQSSARIGRLRTNQIDAFVKKVGDMATRALPADKIKDIVIAGHGELFERVAADPGIASRIKQMIRSDALDLHKIQERITVVIGATDACAIADRMFDALDTLDLCIVYGPEPIAKAAADCMIAECIAIKDANISAFGLGSIVPTYIAANTSVGTRLASMGGVLARTYFPMEAC